MRKRLDYSEKSKDNALMKANRIDIGKAIRFNRKRLSMTQGDIRQAGGPMEYVISDIETGKGNPKLETISKIFAVMDMTIFDGMDKYLSSIRY